MPVWIFSQTRGTPKNRVGLTCRARRQLGRVADQVDVGAVDLGM